MILLIDIGNSAIKVGCWQAQELTVKRMDAFTSVEHGLAQLSKLKPEPLEHAWVCNVASPKQLHWVQQALHRLGCTVGIFHASAQYGELRCGYDHPETLGSDRWAAMVGGMALVGAPFVVIDAGTAVTMDLVARHGQHLGGWIWPQWRFAEQWLKRHTAQLDTSDTPQEADLSVATHTQAAIQNGAAIMEKATLLQALTEAARMLQCDSFPILLCGGYACKSLQGCNHVQYFSNLVLYGLAVHALRVGDLPPSYLTSLEQFVQSHSSPY